MNCLSVNDFLDNVKFCIKNRNFYFLKRSKNINFLTRYGFTIKEVKKVILSLTPLDYQRGPEPDENKNKEPGQIWIFNKSYLNKEIYIKLKIFSYNEKLFLKCISFHEWI